ncbi:hypothetical protein A3736_02240 [Erythrobacter sp. HI0063]|nr:hypothetical protein A3736_02240 [Erythrobacter sp. HI0063]
MILGLREVDRKPATRVLRLVIVVMATRPRPSKKCFVIMKLRRKVIQASIPLRSKPSKNILLS